MNDDDRTTLSDEDRLALETRVKAMRARLGWIRFANLLLPVGYLPSVAIVLHHLGFSVWSTIPFFILALATHMLVAARFWEVPRP